MQAVGFLNYRLKYPGGKLSAVHVS